MAHIGFQRSHLCGGGGVCNSKFFGSTRKALPLRNLQKSPQVVKIHRSTRSRIGPGPDTQGRDPMRYLAPLKMGRRMENLPREYAMTRTSRPARKLQGAMLEQCDPPA